MKIAVLMPLADQRGGAEQLLRDLVSYSLDDDEVAWLAVFLEEGPMQKEFEALGVETKVVQAGRLREIGWYVAAVSRITDILRQEDIDLVFSWMPKAHMYGGPAAWLADVPAMWYQHGMPDPPNLLQRLVTFLPARHILACSHAVAEAQENLWSSSPISVVHPCANLERFNPENLLPPKEARQRLELPEEGPLIGIVGRLQRWKGIHVLIEAMPDVLASYPNAHCVVVGGRHDLEPEYADDLKARIADLGLEDQVIMAGFQRNVPEWMQAMDVIVHASDHEPFGIVVIEAMALGKPIVAGDAGGPREIITAGVDGLLAPYEDEDDLARQLLRFLDDPEFMHAAGEAARERALEFSPEHYADNFINAIRKIL